MQAVESTAGEVSNHRVAIIGAGWIAGKYIEALRGNPRTTIAGIRSRTAGRGAALLAEHGVEAREYRSDDELFADDQVDVVISCTPPDARREHVVRAAETGRHVIIEKPLGLGPQDLTQMLAAITRAGVVSVAGFVLRWSPRVLTLKRLVDDGLTGELVYAEADYWHPLPAYYHDSWLFSKAAGGSAFLAAGCHAVDALRYLAGEIESVSAIAAGPKSLTGIEYEPVVVANVKFVSGAVGKVSTVLEGDTPHLLNLRIIGTGGAIQNGDIYSSTRFPGVDDYLALPTIRPDRPEGQHPYPALLAHFVDCVDQGTQSHAGIADAARSMAVCFAIDRSCANGGEVVAVESMLPAAYSGGNELQSD